MPSGIFDGWFTPQLFFSTNHFSLIHTRFSFLTSFTDAFVESFIGSSTTPRSVKSWCRSVAGHGIIVIHLFAHPLFRSLFQNFLIHGFMWVWVCKETRPPARFFGSNTGSSNMEAKTRSDNLTDSAWYSNLSEVVDSCVFIYFAKWKTNSAT